MAEQKATNTAESKEQSTQTQNASKTDQLKEEAKKGFSKLKTFGKETMTKVEDRLSMDGQIKQACISLKSFLSPDLSIEQQIPSILLDGAKGIVFLTLIKGGFVVGGSVGTGIVISKINNNQWSGPCSVGLVGGHFGFNVGVQKTDFILILRTDAALKTFSSKGQLKLGADASIAVGPKGRDANVALSANEKAFSPIVSYSMAKGLFIGVTLEGQGIAVRGDCNEKYYGKKVNPENILNGNEQIPNDKDLTYYYDLIQTLTEYTKKIDENKKIQKEEKEKLEKEENEKKAVEEVVKNQPL